MPLSRTDAFMSDFKNDCYILAHKHCLCIEFVLTD